MSVVQMITYSVRKLARNGALAVAIAVSVMACSDPAEQALASGALAQQQFQAGNLSAARTSVARAISARDDVVDLHLLRGRIELAAGARAAAYEAFSAALALDPMNGQALQAVSQLGLTTGHLRESLEATQRVLTLAPNQPDAMLTLGVHHLIRRKYDDAIVQADKILALVPGHENASILKARASFIKSGGAVALDALDSVTGLAASPGVALTKLEIFRELRNAEEMATQFSLLSTLQPDNVELRVDEANFRFKRGERAQAHRLLASALSSSSMTRELVDRAVALWEEYGVEDLSDRAVQTLAQEAPTETKRAVARALIEAGHYDQARSVIAGISGQSGRGLSALLDVRMGRAQRALQLANEVLSRDKTHCDALVAQSLASLDLKRPAQALQSGQLAAAECPNFASAWLVTADSYEALGRNSGVERVYTQATSSLPQSLPIVRSFADWLLHEGRDREAIAIARRLTRDAPASLAAWRLYAVVCRRAKNACERQAQAGHENAKTVYAIDMPPGEPLPNGLFGRLSRS